MSLASYSSRSQKELDLFQTKGSSFLPQNSWLSVSSRSLIEVAREGSDEVVPLYRAQVILDGAVERHGTESATRRRRADLRTVSSSGVTVEVVTIGCKGRGVALEICREIMALLHGVHLVVAIASSIGTLADEHTTSLSLCDLSSRCCRDGGGRNQDAGNYRRELHSRY